MNKKKLFNILITIVICFCLLPNYVSAVTINRTNNVWTSKDHLGYATLNYNTKGVSGTRTTSNLVLWKTSDGVNVFCVEPTVRFDENSISGYQELTTQEQFNTLTNTGNKPHKWKVSDDITNLKKVFSCWYNTDASLMATQAIVWELVTEERTKIDETKILNGSYTPYQSDGTIYGNQSGITSLYELIKARSKINSAYESVLRCAARFDEKPSFSYAVQENAQKSPKKLDGSYTAATADSAATWSKTFTHSTSNSLGKNILKYYEVTSSSSDVNVSITNNGTSLKVSTSKEILKEDAVRITLKYAYKDDGTTALNTNSNVYYVKEDTSKDDYPWYQTLGKGSTTLETYIYVYTGPKPTYQLRVKKVDKTTGKAMTGVKFYVYDSKGNKIGTTTETNSNGYAYYKETGKNAITEIGEYKVKEVGVVDGYLVNNQTITVTVTDDDRTGTSNYGESNTIFENVQNNLKLTKKTIDENGKPINMKDYTGETCGSGDYIGPVFTLTKDNKDICVVQNSYGNYTVVNCNTENSTNEIKTCNGEFSVNKLPAGCYNVKEIKAPDGLTLDQNPIKEVCIESGKNPEPITFFNGVSGVIFNKVSEDGYLLDGGKYALQQKVNGIYKDMLLKLEKGVVYSYVEDLKDTDEGATYILETDGGILQVKNLPIGEYRFVEKEAPEGYDIIKDKDSKATFTISDKGIFGKDGKPVTDYYQVRLVNQEVRVSGSYDSAELIVTIITGRKVANYALIIGGLAVLLVALIILRKKFKK